MQIYSRAKSVLSEFEVESQFIRLGMAGVFVLYLYVLLLMCFGPTLMPGPNLSGLIKSVFTFPLTYLWYFFIPTSVLVLAMLDAISQLRWLEKVSWVLQRAQPTTLQVTIRRDLFGKPRLEEFDPTTWSRSGLKPQKIRLVKSFELKSQLLPGGGTSHPTVNPDQSAGQKAHVYCDPSTGMAVAICAANRLWLVLRPPFYIFRQQAIQKSESAPQSKNL